MSAQGFVGSDILSVSLAMFPFFPSGFPLKQKDFYLLSEKYCREIEKMLPVRGSVDFRGPAWNKEQGAQLIGDQYLEKCLTARTSALDAGIVENRIILPLYIEDGENIAVVVGDIDRGLLAKMDQEWLSGFREAVQSRLEKIKQDFTDPVTGLYNSRLLMDSLEQSSRTGRNNVLFLICVKSRTRSAIEQLPRTVQAGSCIDTMTGAPLFYLGGNVFALLQDRLTRHEALNAAHRFLRHLKREGLQSVHIGITLPDESRQSKNGDMILAECWRALETAERRGTFSFCEGSYLADAANHPLAVPGKKVLSQLRKKWRGLKTFSLFLLNVDTVSAGSGGERNIGTDVAAVLPSEASIISLSPGEIYILVPGPHSGETLELGKKIQSRIEKRDADMSASLGICHWPLLHFTKTESAVNCRKALMHGRFYGPGSVTVFDHVSLNVSGDYFFDEGDYRQAVRDYRTGVRLVPDDINLLNSMGVALTSLNRIRGAVVYFDRVLAIDADDFMALVNKGFAQRILGNQDRAIRCFEQASGHEEFTRSGVFEEVSLQLGRLYCDSKQYDRALVLLQKLERIRGSQQGYSLFLLMGEALAETGRNREAITYLQKAVQGNPRDAQALSLLGYMYAVENQGNEIALSLCRKAVHIDDTFWKNWFRLALVQCRMGLLKDARVAVTHSLRINRNAVEALSLAEQIYLRTGEQKRARSVHHRLLKIARTDQMAVKAMRN